MGGKWGISKSCPKGSETLDMTFEGLEKIFEGDFAYICGEKFPLVIDGGLSGGSSVREQGPPSAQAKIVNMELAKILRQFIDMRVITIFFTSL